MCVMRWQPTILNKRLNDFMPGLSAKVFRTYNASITMVDLQLEHTTHCALPSHRFPGEQGWYPYLGDRAGTTEEYFALSAIIAAGR